MGTKWGYSIYSRYEQNTTKIPHKCVVLHKIYTPHANLWGDRRTDGRTDRRTDGRMDGRTDGRSENIYSIFRDKLLLLGEHVYI